MAAFLGACRTAERTADQAAEGAEDGADAVATVARGAADAAGDAAGAVAGAVTDAAGTVYNGARDLFEGDPEIDAVALIRPTSEPGARVQGTARFHEMDDGLMVMVSLRGLEPGRHGIHIHENPACGMGEENGRMVPGGAAGSHWDPMRTMNHAAPTESVEQKHLGDLGNVTAGADGTVETEITVASFPDNDSVAGHSVVVHADADDLQSDPGGGSGGRLGCGVIEARM